MTLRQVEVFLAIAREKSVSQAARTIHLSQPTLSEHMAELQRELGVELFSRHGRSIALSEAGRLFEPYARAVLSAVVGARQALAELDGMARGMLLIGGSTTPGTYVLPGIIAAFRKRYPGISVTLRVANSREIEERVRAGELDLGVVGGHVLGPGEQCLAAGLVDELWLIVPPRHALARRRSVEPRELAAYPLLMREDGSATRLLTERGLRQAGIAFETAMQLDHVESVKQGVMAGLGVAFVSRHAIRGELATGRLRALRVRGLRLLRHFHAIHAEGRPVRGSVRAFMGFLGGKTRARPPGRPQRSAARTATL